MLTSVFGLIKYSTACDAENKDVILVDRPDLQLWALN